MANPETETLAGFRENMGGGEGVRLLAGRRSEGQGSDGHRGGWWEQPTDT